MEELRGFGKNETSCGLIGNAECQEQSEPTRFRGLTLEVNRAQPRAGRVEGNGNHDVQGRAPATRGWVRVEREVRPSPKRWCPERTARLDSNLLERERKIMPTTPKGKHRSYGVKMKAETLK